MVTTPGGSGQIAREQSAIGNWPGLSGKCMLKVMAPTAAGKSAKSCVQPVLPVAGRKEAKLMRSAGLKGCPAKRYRVRSGGPAGGSVARNLLQQDFSAIKINTRWACDMTYIWTVQGWLYLAVVMDLCSRRIVGWSMSRRINRHLALDALQMALAYRHPDGGLILITRTAVLST